MKKLFIAFFLLIVLIAGLIYLTESRLEYNNYYILSRNNCFIKDNDNKMNFQISTDSSDSIIIYEELNTYQLEIDGMLYLLNNVECEYIAENKIEITSSVIECMDYIYNKKAYLRIINSTFELVLDLGSISILNPSNYELLSVDSLYGSYSIINNNFHLVGINITFSDDFEMLNEMKIGSYVYGNLNKVIFDKYLDNEIIITNEIDNYRVDDYLGINQISLESNKLFIPVVYEELLFIDKGYITFVLDNKNYYLDVFPFVINNEYYLDKESMTKGEITYARA